MISDVILDIEALRQITDGDHVLEQALIRLYCSTAERCIGKLRLSAAEGNSEEWKKLAHEFRGASANIHANQMTALCKYAEHEEDKTARLQVCDNLDKSFVTLKVFCSSWLQ